MQQSSNTSDASFKEQRELKAAEGLLGLRYLSSSSAIESFHLSPIMVGDNAQPQQLPPVSYLLSEYASSSALSSNTCSPKATDDYFYNLAPTASVLSVSSISSSSASSIHSFASTSTLQQQQQQKGFRSLIHNRRRGRPKKALSAKMNEDLKIISYDQTTVTAGNMVTINKPRWQNSERQDLIEAIVKEKSLDDMSSIPWDKVSKAVGRAKKACKDQWRRELLPGLVRGFIRGSGSTSTSQQPYEDVYSSKKKRKNETRK